MRLQDTSYDYSPDAYIKIAPIRYNANWYIPIDFDKDNPDVNTNDYWIFSPHSTTMYHKFGKRQQLQVSRKQVDQHNSKINWGDTGVNKNFILFHYSDYNMIMKYRPNWLLAYGALDIFSNIPGIGPLFSTGRDLLMTTYAGFNAAVKLKSNIEAASRSAAGAVVNTLKQTHSTYHQIKALRSFLEYRSPYVTEFPMLKDVMIYPQRKVKQQLDINSLYYYMFRQINKRQYDASPFDYIYERNIFNDIQNRIFNKSGNIAIDVNTGEVISDFVKMERDSKLKYVLQTQLRKMFYYKKRDSYWGYSYANKGDYQTNWWNPKGFKRWFQGNEPGDGVGRAHSLKKGLDLIYSDKSNPEQFVQNEKIIQQRHESVFPFHKDVKVGIIQKTLMKRRDIIQKIPAISFPILDEEYDIDKYKQVASSLWGDQGYGNPIKFFIFNKILNRGMLTPIFLTSQIKDDVSSQWDSQVYPGHLYPRAHYKGISMRYIEFGIKLLCPSFYDIDVYVEKLNFIRDLSLPLFTQMGQTGVHLPKAPICQLTLGDVIYQQIGYFQTAQITYDLDEMIWNLYNVSDEDRTNIIKKFNHSILLDYPGKDIKNINIEIPLICDISFKFNILYSTCPQAGKQMYKVNG